MIKKEKNKSRLVIIGSLIIIGSLVAFASYHLYNYVSLKQDDAMVEQFFDNESQEETPVSIDEPQEETKQETKPQETYNYVGILEIPNINFKRGFLKLGDKNNTVSKNIEVLQNSDMPNVVNGLLAIAGHSGSGRVAFFKNLHKLNVKDEVFVYYENIKYVYEISKIYEEEKDGTIDIDKKSDETILVLTTCSQTDDTKQIVIIAKQINKLDY